MKFALVILTVALVVAVAFAGYGLYQYSSCSLDYATLQSDFSELRQSYEQLRSKYSGLEKSYSELRDRYEVLKSKYSKLEENYSRLSSDYEALKSELTEQYARSEQLEQWLEGNKTLYEQKIAQLVDERNTLASWLQGNISYYEGVVVNLSKELTNVKNWLYGNISVYKEKVSRLTYENSELRSKLISYESWLRGNISYYTYIISRLNTTIQNYEEQSEKIYAVAYLPSVNQSLRNAFLSESIDAVKEFTKEVFSNVEGEDAIIKIFEWILLNTYYQHDPYVLVPTEEGGYKNDNIWKLANETLANEGGDCEDLATLAYSVLKNLGFKVWLLYAYNGSEGHVSALIKYGNNWYILDPAGNWLNGYGIWLKMDVTDTEGKGWWIWLSPLDVTSSEKDWLLTKKFATMVWWDYDNDEEIAQPSITRADLQIILDEWARYWNNWYNEFAIIDVGLSKEFNNTRELSDYLIQT